jgi:hypothetical protein
MRTTSIARLLSVPVVAGIVAGGVWVTGGLVTDDFRLAMALTAAWMAVSGAACLAVAVRRRPLRVPVLAAWVVTAAAIGTFLGLNTLVDRTVHETVVVAGPMAAPQRPEEANVEVASGRLRSGEHETAGRAAVVRVPGGARWLTLTRFSTSPGPDLRVRVGGRDLGALKGNRGDQQYRVPAALTVEGARLVIWCRAFSVEFGSARLSDAA